MGNAKLNEYQRKRYWADPQKARTRGRLKYRKKKGYSLDLSVSLGQDDLREGVKWEKYVAEKYFKKARLKNNEGFYSHAPYDLETEVGKVDVKSVNLWADKKGRSRWHFFIKPRTKRFIPDYYCCVCLDKEVVIKCYLIPGKLLGTRLTLGNKSKYDQFKIVSLQGILVD